MPDVCQETECPCGAGAALACSPLPCSYGKATRAGWRVSSVPSASPKGRDNVAGGNAPGKRTPPKAQPSKGRIRLASRRFCVPRLRTREKIKQLIPQSGTKTHKGELPCFLCAFNTFVPQARDEVLLLFGRFFHTVSGNVTFSVWVG